MAFSAFNQNQHLTVKKSYQCPCPGQRHKRLFTSLGGQMFQIQAIGFDDCFDAAQIGMLTHEVIHVDKQRRMNIRLPGNEPVS